MYDSTCIAVYVLGIFSRGHENKFDDVERILDGYMKHRESRSFLVRPDGDF